MSLLRLVCAVLLYYVPIELQDLIYDNCILLISFLDHLVTHANHISHEVPVSLHSEVCIVIEVFHILDATHFKAHICVFRGLRGVREYRHYCAD